MLTLEENEKKMAQEIKDMQLKITLRDDIIASRTMEVSEREQENIKIKVSGMVAKNAYEAQIRKLIKDLDENRELLNTSTAYLKIEQKKNKNREKGLRQKEKMKFEQIEE